MFQNHRLSILAVSSLLAAVGCAADAGGETVDPSFDTVDQTAQALSGTVTGLRGIYTSCKGQTNGATWNTASGSSTPIAVVRNDESCILTLKQIDTAVGEDTVSYTGSIAIGTSFTTPAAFALSTDQASAVVFFVNAKRTDYNSGFAITLKYSGDAKNETKGKQAQHASVTATPSQSGVNPPDYTMSTDGVDLRADADNKVYDIANAGSISLTSVAQNGEEYAILASGALSDSPTFAAINTAWAGATPTTFANAGVNPSLAASLFLADLDVLPQTRWLVIKHTDSTTNVVSYETFKVTFSAPL
jgi:hypothetical protein